MIYQVDFFYQALLQLERNYLDFMNSETRIVFKICDRFILHISRTKRTSLHNHVTDCPNSSPGLRNTGKSLKVQVQLQCVSNIVTTVTLEHTYRMFHKVWTQFYRALFRCGCQILVDRVPGCFPGTGIWLSQWQWCNPKGYGYKWSVPTTTKTQKWQTLCMCLMVVKW